MDIRGNVMTSKTVRQVSIDAFTADNVPTCAIGPTREETCIFYRTKKFGLVEFCSVADKDLERGGLTHNGYLIPCEDCIVWK
jgi:hypothetical protein